MGKDCTLYTRTNQLHRHCIYSRGGGMCWWTDLLELPHWTEAYHRHSWHMSLKSGSHHQGRIAVYNVCSRCVIYQLQTELNKHSNKYVSKIWRNTKRSLCVVSSLDLALSDFWLFPSGRNIWRVCTLRPTMRLSRRCVVGVINHDLIFSDRM